MRHLIVQAALVIRNGWRFAGENVYDFDGKRLSDGVRLFSLRLEA
jgi:hypothetical protein